MFHLKLVHVSSLELIFCHQEIQKVEEVHRKHFAWETCWQFIRGVAIQMYTGIRLSGSFIYLDSYECCRVQVFAVIRDIVLVIVVPKVVVSCRCWVILCCGKSRPIWGHTTLTCGYLRSTQWTCTDWICMDLFVCCSLFTFLHFCLWVSRTMANLKQAFLHVFA